MLWIVFLIFFLELETLHSYAFFENEYSLVHTHTEIRYQNSVCVLVSVSRFLAN